MVGSQSQFHEDRIFYLEESEKTSPDSSPQEDNVVHIQDLRKTFGQGEDSFTLEVPSLDLPDVGLFLLSGKSGCGKTTLLDLIAGLEKPDSGEVLIDGKEVVSSPEFYRNKLTYVLVEDNVFEGLTAMGNLLLATKDEKKAKAMADAFGLDGKARTSKMSKGESERLALACALLKETPILLVDEPTANLDEENAIKAIDLLKAYSADHLVLIASHDVDLIESNADGTIVLEEGKVVSEKKADRQGDPVSEKTNARSSKTPLLSLGIRKALFSKTAYCFSSILLFLSFFALYLGFDFLGFQEQESLRLSLDDKKTYVCEQEGEGDVEEAIPSLARMDTESGRFAIYIEEDVEELLPSTVSFPETGLVDGSIPLFIDEELKAEIDSREDLSSEIGMPFPLLNDTLPFVIAGYFDSGETSSFPMGVCPLEAYEDYLHRGLSTFATGDFDQEIEGFYESLEEDVPMGASFLSGILSDVGEVEFLPYDEAKRVHDETGEDTYYRYGFLPEASDEILVDNETIERYFFGEEKNLGEEYLLSQGKEELTVTLQLPGGLHSPVEKTFRIVGSYGVFQSGPDSQQPCLLDSGTFSSLVEEELEKRKDFLSPSYSMDYLLDHEDSLIDGNIDVLGYDIFQAFSSILGSGRTFWIALALALFLVSLLLSFLYLITIAKSLGKEDRLLSLWGFRKKERLWLYLCSMLTILVLPFLLALVLAPSLFPLLVDAIYSYFPGVLVFSPLYGFLSLFLSFIVILLLFLIPFLIKRSSHGSAN